MRHYVSPALVRIAPDASLVDAVHEHAATRPNAPLFRRKADGVWHDVSATAFRDDVMALARGFVAAGIRAGDRVALMSRTRYEWTLTDYALWAAGAVSVPIFETASIEQVRWILRNTEPVAVVVETAQHAATVRKAMPAGSSPGRLWTFDDGDLASLVRDGSAVGAEEMGARRRSVGASSIATIVHTSGTTGRPRGCVLTHGNFLFGATTAVEILPEVIAPGASALLFLPLAHVLAREFQVACLLAACPIGHSPGADDLAGDLVGFAPTMLLAVPRVFEKVYATARQRAAESGRLALFDRAMKTATAYGAAGVRTTGQTNPPSGPGLALRARHALYDRLVYRKMRAALGGRTAWVISGGAPLPVHLAHLFRGIGVQVLEGWGMTETTAAAAINRPGATVIGTVGRPLPGVELNVADDGELLLRGDIVAQGYWRDPAATDEMFSGGWLHTGDLGHLDDGFVTITGRKKDIIVTANGKNVAPSVLEDRLRAHPLIAECLVVGDARPYVACLITLDAMALGTWAREHAKPSPATVAALREDPDLHRELQGAVDDANAAVSRAESIRRFAILDVEFTESTGQLTPTLKVRRATVATQFADDIERLYA